MSMSAMIRARTDPALKHEVEKIFKQLGLTTTEVINLLFRQIKLRKGIPFEIAIPKEATLRTFKKTDRNKNIVRSKDAKDMFDKLGI